MSRAIYVSLANTCNSFTNLCLSTGFAWMLVSKEDYGQLQQVILFSSFILSILSGFPTGLSYFFGRYQLFTDRIYLFRRFFNSMIIATFGICILFYLNRNIIASGFENYFIVEEITLVILLIFLRSTSSYFTNFLTIINKAKILFIVNFLFFIGAIILIILFLLKTNLIAASHLLIGLVVLELLRMLAYLQYIYKYFPFGNSYLVFKDELFYIIPITGVSLLNTIYVFIDKYMISVLMTPVDYANYQVGAFVIPFIGIITGSLMVTLLPSLSKLKNEDKLKEIITLLRKTTEKTTVLLIPIFVFCVVFGRELITSIYSDSYVFSGEIFQIYSFRFFTTVILFSLTMSAIGLQNWVLITSLFGLTINVILNYYLISIFGVMGAVYATLVATYIGVIPPVILINRVLKTNLFSYLPVKLYLATTILSVLTSLILYQGAYEVLSLSKLWCFPISVIFYIVILTTINTVFKIFDLDSLVNLVKVKIENIAAKR